MGVEESERRSFSVTEPQHVADLEEFRNGRVQRQPRQAPSIIQISTIITATTWVTRTVEETIYPLADSGNHNQRYPISSDSPSPAAVIPTPAPSTPRPMDIPSPLPGQAPTNSSQSNLVPQKNPAQLGSWTEKVLIAAGSIGATLLIAFVIIMIYRWRKKKSLPRIGSRNGSRKSPEHKIQEPFVPVAPWNNDQTIYAPTLDKNRWDMNSSAGSLIFHKPTPAFSNPDSSSSHRASPLGMHQQPSQSRFPPPNPLPSPSPLAERSVLFIDPRESRLQFTMMQPRRASDASSSPVLPIEGPGVEDLSVSEKRRSSVPSLLHAQGVNEFTKSPPKASRFSWTNSQAPKTPMDLSRFSIATSTSSVPRYRTVESWVGNQAGRLDEEVFQGYLQKEIESRIHRMSTRPNASAVTITTTHMADKDTKDSTSRQSNIIPPSAAVRRPGGTARHSRLRASDFMQHPGTEVRIPRVSLIPSEILDSKVGQSEL